MLLDLKIMLPVIRQAITDRTLQIYTDPRAKCTYAGPCAVGICIPVDQRAALDRVVFASVKSQLHSGTFKAAPGTNPADLVELQITHDCGDIPAFEATVTDLEAKYAS